MKNSFIITNAKIITMADSDIQNGCIEVDCGKIAAVYEGKPQGKEDLPVYDLGKKTIYPGFIDIHCHIGMFNDGLAFEGEDGNEDTDPVTPNLRAADAVNPFDRCFDEALEAGVTTMLSSPGSANPISGKLAAFKSYAVSPDKLLFSDDAGMKFALGENPKNTYSDKNQSPVTRMATAAIIREQLSKAKRYLEDIERANKDEDFDKPEYDTKAEALLPVLKREKKAYFHAHRADDILTAMRISKEFSLDYVIVHCTEGHIIAKLLKDNHVSCIVGPIISDRGKPELAKLTIKNGGILEQNGVFPAICTDHPEIPIQYLPLSMAICVKGGMSRKAALQGITCNAAKIAGLDGTVGSIECGKDANFVIFENENDPFDILKSPEAVIVDGMLAKGCL